jgi:predicted nucleotidyltransferase
MEHGAALESLLAQQNIELRDGGLAAARAELDAVQDEATPETTTEKRQALSRAHREFSQRERDRATLASSVKAIADEVLASLCLRNLLANEHRVFLSSFLSRYSALDERFFASSLVLAQHIKDTHLVDAWLPSGPAMMSDAQSEALAFGINLLLPALMPGKEFAPTRQAVIKRLQRMLDEEGFPQIYPGPPRLVPFGSSANGCGGPSSDLDLCLVIHGAVDGTEVVERISALLRKREFDNVDDARKTARIPIVQFMDPVSKIECDICINNTLAIRNTRLLRTYVEIDARVQGMIYFVKHWAKRRKLNDPSLHTLSSYAWLLLVINYLQRIGMLPVLQMTAPDGTKVDSTDKLPSVMERGPDGKEWVVVALSPH